MLTVTETAEQKIREILEQQPRDSLAVHVRILARGMEHFMYDFGLVPEEAELEGAATIKAHGFKVIVDAESAPNLEGATIDFDTEKQGFRVENPNPVWEDELGRRVAEVIVKQINPGIASHGGAILPVNVTDGVVYVRMFGGCQGCGMASVTLTSGVEQQIKAALPEITDVVDITHHAAGTNPYYKNKQGAAG